MGSTRDVLDRGFPVTLRLAELPGFAAFVEAQRGNLGAEERAHLADWLVVVDAEELDAGVSFTALFHEHLGRTREELEERLAQAA
jgi:hypothetical protein